MSDLSTTSLSARKEHRGGARPGSGRKSFSPKKVTISFRVTEEIRGRIQQLRESGVDVNHELEALVRKLSD